MNKADDVEMTTEDQILKRHMDGDEVLECYYSDIVYLTGQTIGVRPSDTYCINSQLWLWTPYIDVLNLGLLAPVDGCPAVAPSHF
jgi:hypothetical protein